MGKEILCSGIVEISQGLYRFHSHYAEFKATRNLKGGGGSMERHQPV